MDDPNQQIQKITKFKRERERERHQQRDRAEEIRVIQHVATKVFHPF